MIAAIRVLRFRTVRIICVAALFVASSLGAATAPERARELYQRAEFEASLKLLLPVPEKNADVYQLIGRNYYGLGDFKKATDFLQKAVAAEPESPIHHLWLGRAWGRRAETSSLLTAPGYASRARQHFEKAVALNPASLEAVNDLFEYYLEAPGFLGGGYDKAAKLAEEIGRLDRVEGHWAQAKLAEKRKQYPRAEQNLRRAAELAPQEVGRLLDLAKFLAKRGRFQESEQSFQRAETLAPGSPQVMFARADTYIRHKRNLDTARELLERYLAAELTPDDPPRSEAEKLLKQVSGS